MAADRAPTAEAGGRRAWVLGPLFNVDGSLLGTAELIVHDMGGTPTRIPRAMHAGFGRVWVLRDDDPDVGTVEVALVDAGRPFAPLPDTGAGQPLPHRIRGVTRLQLLVQGDMHRSAAKPVSRDRPAQIRALEALTVTVDGKEGGFEEGALEGLALLRIPSPRGGDLQSAWDVRALVERLAGDGARLASVVATDGAAVAVGEALWRDGSRRPVLRLNRQGRLKFHWVLQDGRTDREAPDLRGVGHLYIVAP